MKVCKNLNLRGVRDFLPSSWKSTSGNGAGDQPASTVNKQRPLSINPTSEHDPSPVNRPRISWGSKRIRIHQFKNPHIRPIIRVLTPINNEEEFLTEEEETAISALLMLANQIPPPIREILPEPNRWPITKVLTETDLSLQQNRLLIKRKEALSHIISHLDKQSTENVCSDCGLRMKLEDIDTNEELELTLKWRSSSDCYHLNGGWYNNFVVSRKLKKGDTTRLFWSPNDKKLFFSVLRHAN